MNSGEKYAKVLALREKKTYAAEDELGFGRNTITNAIKEGRKLSDKYHNKFINHFGVNPRWWDTGQGPELLEGDGPVGIDGRMGLSEAIRAVVEDGTEYLVVPRLVLEGKYRLVPIEQIEKEQKELETRSEQIQALHGIIRDMSARPINIQLSKVENT